MFEWTEDVIRFRRDAAVYMGFDDIIAGRLLLNIHPPAGVHICDCGCGLGYMALALAEKCAHVTAIDTSKAALTVLCGNICEHGIRNISPVCADVFTMEPPAGYDAMVFCFFGGLIQTLTAAKKQCSGKLIMVKKDWRERRFTLNAERPVRFSAEETVRGLDDLGIPHECDGFELDMGQPFRSVEDAALFFSLYGNAPADMDAVRKRLSPVSMPDMPDIRYILHAVGRVCIITVDTGDIPDTIINGKDNTK